LEDNKINMERIFLIGGNGFIGIKLKEILLKNGYLVYSPNKNEFDLTENNAAYTLANLLKKDDILIFLACITPDKLNPSSLTLNLKMGLNLVEAIKIQKIKKIIYFSTEAVYNNENILITEDLKPNPISIYGSMHLMRENLLNELSEIDSLILRPTMVYGINDTHNAYGINRFIKTAINSNIININGCGNELRDYIYIDDLCNLTLYFIKNNIKGVFNMASGYSYSFKDIANSIKNIIGTELKIEYSDNHSFHGDRHFDINKIKKLNPNFIFNSLNNYIKKSITKNEY